MTYIILLLIIIAFGVFLLSPLGRKILVWIGGLSIVGGLLFLVFLTVAAFIAIFNGGTGNTIGTGILVVIGIFLFAKMFIFGFGKKTKSSEHGKNSHQN
jgi:hypothetical protein